MKKIEFIALNLLFACILTNKVCWIEKQLLVQFGEICFPKKQKTESNHPHFQTLNYHPKLKHISIKRLKNIFNYSIEKGVNIFIKNIIFYINKKFFCGFLKYFLDIIFKTVVDVFSKMISFIISHFIIKVLILGIQMKFKTIALEMVLDNFIRALIEITLTKIIQPYALMIGKRFYKIWKALMLKEKYTKLKTKVTDQKRKLMSTEFKKKIKETCRISKYWDIIRNNLSSIKSHFNSKSEFKLKRFKTMPSLYSFEDL